MTIREMQRRCYEQAEKSGWAGPGTRDVPLPEAIALVHSELSEALEAWRNGEPMSWTDDAGKPQGVGAEFADVLIRLGHYATLYQLDLEMEVQRKLAYNATRPYRHGGKVG